MLNLENLDNIAQKNREEEGEGDRKVKGSEEEEEGKKGGQGRRRGDIPSDNLLLPPIFSPLISMFLLRGKLTIRKDLPCCLCNNLSQACSQILSYHRRSSQPTKIY